MVKFVKFRASDVLPNPAEVLYWVDLNTDPLGGSIKVYNAEGEWETIKVLQGTLPEFEKRIKEWVISELAKFNNLVDAKLTEFEGTIAVINQSVEDLRAIKLDKLTAGSGIDITDNVVSCIVDLALYKIVTALPTDESLIEANKIYLLVNLEGPEDDRWSEYIYVNKKWELLGLYKTPIDLTPYLTKELAANTYLLIGDYSTNTDLEAVDTKLNSEIARATASEVVLRTDLESEITRSINTDTLITERLDTEITRSKGEDSRLDTALKQEVSRATEKENVIIADLANEKTRAINAEKLIADNLIAETGRATDAETVLRNNLSKETSRAVDAETTISGNLTKEITRSIEAESLLEEGLTTEVTRAKSEEKRIENKVDTHATDSIRIERESKDRDTAIGVTVSTEVSDRKAADTVITTSVTTEVNRAKAAEKVNADNISLANTAIATETTQRKAADADLLTKVNTKVSKVTVVKDPTNNLHYTLMVDDVNKGDINIPKDLFLKSATYDTATKDLVFVFETSEGESISRVGVGSLVDTYTAGNGLNLVSNKFSITVDPGTESFLTVTATGIKVTGITTAINAAVTVEKNRATAAESVLTNNKVDKVTGKGLSTNDYTTAEKTKLSGLSNYNDASLITLISTKANITDVYPKTLTYSKVEVDAKIDESGSFDPTKYYTSAQTDAKLFVKLDTLVSGTNLKTLANLALLGSGNITLANIGAEPAFTKNTAFNKNFGAAAGTVTQGNDARLSDSRPASDVYAWAKASVKPTYGYSEITGTPPAADLTNYVTLNTPQTITGAKTFATSITASGFVKSGGTSNQLFRADGGVASFLFVGKPGQPTWLWGGNTIHDYNVWNPANFNVNSARYIPPAYNGGIKINPQDYFNADIGLKVAMTGAVTQWTDTLWINGYTGADVPNMTALHTNRGTVPKMWISNQSNRATEYGTMYEVLTDYNLQSKLGSKYLPLTGGTLTGTLNMGPYRITLSNETSHLQGGSNGDGSVFLRAGTAGATVYFETVDQDIKFRKGNGAINVIWHSGNDGAGSTLDADLLDGVQGSQYFQQSRGDIAVADLNTFVNRNSGTYRVINALDTDLLNVFNISGAEGSASGIEIHNNYNGLFRYRIGVNNNQYSKWFNVIRDVDCNENPVGNTIVRRNASGDVLARYLFSTQQVEDTTAIDRVYFGTSTDGFIRKCSLSRFREQLNIPTAVQGPKGDTGATGPIGPAGPKGDTGSTGALGVRGILGIQGILGTSGTNATITSATATALAAGSNPTVTLGGTASARTFAFGIPRGANGTNGALGERGLTGPTGAQGIQGVKGDKGDKGDTGATGAPGTTTWEGITNKPKLVTGVELNLYYSPEAFEIMPYLRTNVGEDLTGLTIGLGGATQVSAGVMTAADKIKLDSLLYKMVRMNQTSYDNLTTKDPTTLYIIVD